MTEERPTSETFTIDIGDGDKHLRRPISKRQRFLGYKKRDLTLDELEKKQNEAQLRRQRYEEQTLARIREKHDDCIKIDRKVTLLLQQEAKRKGLPGTECIKPMSRAEAQKTIQSVAKDFSKISAKISTKTKAPQS